MIVCGKCGFENEDSDAFCGSCASFLEWNGQRVAQEAPEPEVEPEVEPEEAHQGLIERVKEKIGIGEERPVETAATTAPENGGGLTTATVSPAAASEPLSTAVAAAPAAALSAEPVSAAAQVAPQPSQPVAAAAQTASEPAAATATAAPPMAKAAPSAGTATPAAAPSAFAPGNTVTNAPPVQPAKPAAAAAPTGAQAPGPVAPGAVQPEAVKPAAVKTRPTPKKAAPTREINPGDKICGQCGEGNDPVRKFCRRCGGSLVEATVFKLPWYKALWRRLTQRKYKEAGHRPKMRRKAFGGHGGWVTSWVTRIVVLAVLVFVALSFVGPWHKTLKSHESRYWHDAVGFVHPTYNPYFAHDAVASSEAPGHPALNLIDGARNTSWQSNGKATGQSVTVHFTGTASIAKVGFDVGDQDTPQSFQTEPRPALVKLEFTGAHPVSRTLPLRDITGFQTFTVDTKDSTGVTVVIEKIYPATGNGQNVSIAQLEFFTKS